MLEKQRESVEAGDHAAELCDGVGYGRFVPRWYEREVNIGGRNRANERSLENWEN
jgi:hypothetical protein